MEPVVLGKHMEGTVVLQVIKKNINKYDNISKKTECDIDVKLYTLIGSLEDGENYAKINGSDP